MRLLIIYHAGAQEGARHIFDALARSGTMELTVAAPRVIELHPIYGGPGWLGLEREVQCDGYRLVPISLRNPANYWQGFDVAELRRVIRQARPQLIHVLDEPISGYLFQVVWQRLSLFPFSKVLFYGFENRPFPLTRHNRLKWRATWALIAGGAAANSEALENVVKAGFPARRPLEHIFWGIPLDLFRPRDKERAKAELGLEFEHMVGYAGRLLPEKGLAVLLDATRRLPPSVHCLIIGSGPMRAELELSAGSSDLRERVHFHDVMEPALLAKYMNSLDALVLPSLTTPHWKEQYGRVLPEAMACGVPVIGSDSGAIPEVVGPAGLIVRENDPAALAEAISDVVFNKETAERCRREGLRRAEEELSARAMAHKLVAFYDRVFAS